MLPHFDSHVKESEGENSFDKLKGTDPGETELEENRPHEGQNKMVARAASINYRAEMFDVAHVKCPEAEHKAAEETSLFIQAA